MASLPALPELAPPPARKGGRALPAAFSPAGRNLETPVARFPPAQLWRVWLEIMAREPRTRLEQHDDARLRSLHVQRSRLFRFPDEIRAEVVALGQDASGISIESRARYGFYDFGVNKRRVRRLIAALEARLDGAAGRREAV